jgi:hypothetical protein
MLAPRLVILLSVLLSNNMGVRGAALQFVATLVIFVMRSVVIAFGHSSNSLHSPRFVAGFLCQLVSVIGIFHRALRMPALGRLIASFIVFSGSTMCLCRKVMVRGGSQVCFVRGFIVCVRHGFPSMLNEIFT